MPEGDVAKINRALGADGIRSIFDRFVMKLIVSKESTVIITGVITSHTLHESIRSYISKRSITLTPDISRLAFAKNPDNASKLDTSDIIHIINIVTVVLSDLYELSSDWIPVGSELGEIIARDLIRPDIHKHIAYDEGVYEIESSYVIKIVKNVLYEGYVKIHVSKNTNNLRNSFVELYGCEPDILVYEGVLVAIIGKFGCGERR